MPNFGSHDDMTQIMEIHPFFFDRKFSIKNICHSLVPFKYNEMGFYESR